jgi:23S rRNA A2030 N6-methylase RlmJ
LLLAELRVLPDDVGGRFYGSALLLHNPPWQLDRELAALGEELHALLASGPGTGGGVRWLVGE